MIISCFNKSFLVFLPCFIDTTTSYPITAQRRDKDKNFGNGRFVRNTFEKVLEHQANRLASISNLTTEQLTEITIEDLPKSAR